MNHALKISLSISIALLLNGCGKIIKSTPVPLSAVAVSASTTSSSVTAQEQIAGDEGSWPQWRGPNRDAISTEKNWQQNWTSPPPVSWQKNIGIGYGTVSITEGQLFVMGHPAGTEEEAVFCLDADTGEEIWSIRYPCGLHDHLHKGGPGTTPTITDDSIYVVSKEGEVRKLNRNTGETDWLVKLKDVLSIEQPEWGFALSPVIESGMIIIDAGTILGLNPEDGSVKWRAGTRQIAYGTPAIFENGPQKLLASLNNEGLSIFEINGSEELAFSPWSSRFDTNSTTPIIHENKIFLSTGYNKGCTLLDFDGETLTSIYENKNMRNHMNTCVLVDGVLYGFDGNSHNRRTVTVKAIDFQTGELLWEERGGLGPGALMVAGERLIMTSDDGELLLVEINKEAFREVGRIRVMKEQCWTMPVFCDGRIYVRGSEGTLSCVDVR